ncbi:MAG: hypothetical protein NVS3B17_11700 [Vulcanimicrobiaceae bacterium]
MAKETPVRRAIPGGRSCVLLFKGDERTLCVRAASVALRRRDENFERLLEVAELGDGIVVFAQAGRA